jgi:type VI secretion system protein ImpJ
MKFLSRVFWSEEMHLGPRHFQTQSRYFEDTLWFLDSNLRQEPWGFLHFLLDTAALRNGLATLSFASSDLPGDLGDATFDLKILMETTA